MLPTRPRKTSDWKGYVGIGQRFNQSFRADIESKLTDLIFDDKLANAKVLSDLEKLNIRRKRTFTGKITISKAGIPRINNARNKAFKVGIIVFVMFDLFLIGYLFKLFNH